MESTKEPGGEAYGNSPPLTHDSTIHFPHGNIYSLHLEYISHIHISPEGEEIWAVIIYSEGIGLVFDDFFGREGAIEYDTNAGNN